MTAALSALSRPRLRRPVVLAAPRLARQSHAAADAARRASESYVGHASAAVLAGRGDQPARAGNTESPTRCLAGDPYLDAAHAIFLLESWRHGRGAAPLIARISYSRTETPAIRMSLHAAVSLSSCAAADLAAARAIAGSARRSFPGDESWYRRICNDLRVGCVCVAGLQKSPDFLALLGVGNARPDAHKLLITTLVARVNPLRAQLCFCEHAE